MKTLLVPTTPHDLMSSVLETAVLVSQIFESVIEGFALRPSFAEYIPVDMVTGLTWVGDEGDDGAAIQRAREGFVRFMQDRSIPPAANRGPGWRWTADAPPGDTYVGSHGRGIRRHRARAPGPGSSRAEHGDPRGGPVRERAADPHRAAVAPATLGRRS
jgi:hypothetical protein